MKQRRDTDRMSIEDLPPSPDILPPQAAFHLAPHSAPRISAHRTMNLDTVQVKRTQPLITPPPPERIAATQRSLERPRLDGSFGALQSEGKFNETPTPATAAWVAERYSEAPLAQPNSRRRNKWLSLGALAGLLGLAGAGFLLLHGKLMPLGGASGQSVEGASTGLGVLDAPSSEPGAAPALGSSPPSGSSPDVRGLPAADRLGEVGNSQGNSSAEAPRQGELPSGSAAGIPGPEEQRAAQGSPASASVKHGEPGSFKQPSAHGQPKEGAKPATPENKPSPAPAASQQVWEEWM